MEAITNRSFKAIIWNASGQFSTQILSLAVGIVLARLLSPNDYGLFAIALLFNGFSSVFIDAGFSAAIIRKKEPTNKDLSTVWFFNIGMSIFVYLIVFFLAPLVAKFFNQPNIILLIRVIGLNFIILAFGTIQSVILRKQLNYKVKSIIAVMSVVVSGLVALFLAYIGFGVWALVWQIGLQNLITVVSYWLVSNWRPMLCFSKRSFTELFSFGSKLMIASFLYEVFTQIYPVIIGKFFSIAQVGFYNRAESYQRLTSVTISNTVNNIAFPSLSLIQDENERLKEAYRRIIRMTMLINVPLMVGLILLAEPLINVLLTEKWITAAVYLKYFCIVGMFHPLHVLILNIPNIKGRSDIFLYLIIINKVLIVFSIFIGFFWGIEGLLIGQIFTAILTFIIAAISAGKFINYGIRMQLFDIFPFFGISAIMYIIGFFVNQLIVSDSASILIVFFVCATFYFLMTKLFKISALNELTNLLKENLFNRNTR
ncbi:MAG: lipopolysaccharide biosynthesis protein [Bacteroidetes bacterium]|nr:lipopolysaccharide biosynthesis protein [Bacteroidota bacterium]